MRILLDVDGVIADYTGAVLKLVQQHTGLIILRSQVVEWNIFELIPPKHHRHIQSALDEPGFCARIDPFPEAVAAVGVLQTFGEVIPVTTPSHTNPTWAYERSAWLAGKFGFAPGKIVQTGYKEVVDGDVMIDDKPENVRKWLDAHDQCEGILWDAPYNQQEQVLPRAYGWDDVYQRLAVWTGRKYQD